MTEKPDMEVHNEVQVPTMPISEHADVGHASTDDPTEEGGTESTLNTESISNADATVVAAAEAKDLRTRAVLMQDELGSILNTVKTIKDNCAKLKSENQSLQEYIESLMAKR